MVNIIIRSAALFLIVFVIVVPIGVLFAAMESAPVVKVRTPASASDAARVKALLREFKALTDATATQRKMRVSQSDMNGALALAARALPFLRGTALVTPDAVRTALSVDASLIPGGRWLNLSVDVKPSDRGLDLSSIQLGPFGLPAGLALPALGFVLDVVLGGDLGQVAIKTIDGVAIDGESVDLGVTLTRAERTALARRAKEFVRATAMVSSPVDVRGYYLALHTAVRDGRLSSEGSVVEFLRFAMDRAYQRMKTDGGSGEFQSALHALAIYCGHVTYQRLVGDVVPAGMTGKPTGCANATLGGRRDLRRHFVISAGLQAASDAGIVFAIGEFKELLDSNRGGSGFSFDDLAANRAGIRFAMTLIEAKPEQLKGLLDTLGTERAIFPRISDVPAGLSDSEFERRFGNIDNPAYQEVLANIERRIDALAFFLPR